MLGSFAASNAAKIAALCVCPVGAAVVVTQVPLVRSAVHRMTAPRHVPARRIAPRAIPAANIPEQTAMAATPCPSAAPILTQGGEALTFALPTLTGAPFDQSLPTSRIAQSFFTSGGGGGGGSSGGSSGGGGGGGGSSGGTTILPTPDGGSNPSALPEPGTWVQFGLGFALLGGAIRSAGSSKKGNAPQDLKVS